jgi:hypothetical protein
MSARTLPRRKALAAAGGGIAALALPSLFRTAGADDDLLLHEVKVFEEMGDTTYRGIWNNLRCLSEGELDWRPATHINEQGQVVFGSRGSTFFWQDGITTQIDVFGKPPPTRLHSMTRARCWWSPGKKTVTQTALWRDGVVTPVEVAGATGETLLNNLGQVAGTAIRTLPDATTERFGFLWDDGAVTDLGLWAPRAINNSSQVVGIVDPAAERRLRWRLLGERNRDAVSNAEW